MGASVTATTGAKRYKLSKLEKSERLLGIALLTPAALLLLAVVVYPIVELLINSLYSYRLTRPGYRFIGLENYAYALFEDDRFWHATLNTVIFAVVTVPGALVVGLGLALLANQPFKVKWPVRLGLLLPWALPLVFAGLIFRWFFEYRSGIVNAAFEFVGLLPQNWITDPNLAFFAVCVAIVWKSSSFMALILLAGLQTIPKSLYEAAEVDGASKWQQFVEITLPMLKPAIVVALIFRTITALQTFDIPYTMTKGGPGNSTETLAMLIHKTTIDYLDVGYGSTMAVCMFVLSMLITAVYLRHVGRQA